MTQAMEAAVGLAVMIGALHHANAYRPKVDSRAFAAAGMLVGLIALWLMGNAWVTSKPVMTAASVELIDTGPGYARFQLQAYKGLPCEHVRTDAYVLDAHGRRAEAGLIFEGDVSPGSSKPVGLIVFEPWLMTWRTERFTAVQFELEHVHQCGLLWTRTRTTSGPFNLPRGH